MITSILHVASTHIKKKLGSIAGITNYLIHGCRGFTMHLSSSSSQQTSWNQVLQLLSQWVHAWYDTLTSSPEFDDDKNKKSTTIEFEGRIMKTIVHVRRFWKLMNWSFADTSQKMVKRVILWEGAQDSENEDSVRAASDVESSACFSL